MPAAGILLCVDAIQSCGVLPVDVQGMAIDFLSADGHKWMLGPEGCGFFYCHNRHLTTLRPEVGWMNVVNASAPSDVCARPAFCAKLKAFSRQFGVQVYLEPGEAAITGAAELVTTVLDVVHNETDIAIVDASTEAHMLDVLIYRMNARLVAPAGAGPHKVMIAGRSCLAGDVFGQYSLRSRLKPGRVVRLGYAAGYTMVKKNWFNGMPMPSIVVRRLSGRLETVRKFGYKDFAESLS